MKNIGIFSIHPGSGQTTVLVNLASGLIRKAKRVLIGDLGQSSRLWAWLGFTPDVHAANPTILPGSLQGNIFTSPLGMDLLPIVFEQADHQTAASLTTSLEQLEYDYFLLHPATDQVCLFPFNLIDQFLVCTDLQSEDELSEMQNLHTKLLENEVKTDSVSIIVPNRIDTRRWDYNNRQLTSLGDYFGFDKIADPIPT